MTLMSQMRIIAHWCRLIGLNYLWINAEIWLYRRYKERKKKKKKEKERKIKRRSERKKERKFINVVILRPVTLHVTNLWEVKHIRQIYPNIPVKATVKIEIKETICRHNSEYFSNKIRLDDCGTSTCDRGFSLHTVNAVQCVVRGRAVVPRRTTDVPHCPIKPDLVRVGFMIPVAQPLLKGTYGSWELNRKEVDEKGGGGNEKIFQRE